MGRSDDRMRELSSQFAQLCGLPIPHPTATAGELHDASGRVVWHWYKCPKHNTWLQPSVDPYEHWSCSVQDCDYVRAAKMRTFTERELFRLWRHIVTHG